MRKYLVSILVLQIVTLFFVIGARSQAATSYKVHNEEPITLKNTITADQTTNIVFVAAYINGAYQTFATQSGGILELVSNNRLKKEYIYYSSATVDQTVTTKDITLSGVVRGYCWNNATDSQTFAACGDANTYIWERGTEATLSPDMRLFNMNVKKDIENVITGSGAIQFSGSGSFDLPRFASAAARDQAYPNPMEGRKIYRTDTDVEELYSGGAWVQASSGATVNAGYGNSGKVELATPAEILAATGSGATNAALVPAVKDIVTSSGSVASQLATANVVATTGATIHPSLTGSGARNGTKFLRDDGTWQADRIGTGANLIIDAVYNAAAISNASSTTFAQIHSSLQKSATIAVGDLLDLRLTMPTIDGATPCSQLFFDFQIGGGNITGDSSGAGGGFCTSEGNQMSIHYLHTSQTGGTVNLQPLYRVNAGQIGFDCSPFNCRFQVIKYE